MRMNLKLYAAIYVLCSSVAYAGNAEIRNETDSPITVFVRQHGQGNSYQTSIISEHDTKIIYVNKELLGLQSDQFYYDIIASSALESTIEPDWRLFAGECDNISSKHDAIILIQTTVGGLKTTCKILKR